MYPNQNIAWNMHLGVDLLKDSAQLKALLTGYILQLDKFPRYIDLQVKLNSTSSSIITQVSVNDLWFDFRPDNTYFHLSAV